MPDKFGLKTDWSDAEGQLPPQRLAVVSNTNALWRGEHPSVYKGTAWTRLNPFKAPENTKVSSTLRTPTIGDTTGHALYSDFGFGAPLGQTSTPIAPLYARDLAGRVIYVGGQAVKKDELWPEGLTLLTPLGSRDVELGDMQGRELLENIFLYTWRPLDVSADYESLTSGQPESLHAVIYRNHNLYPYKQRLDSFYIDGYKLPQLQCLHVVREGVKTPEAENAGAEILRLWADRKDGQSYEDFIESLGEEKIEAFYRQGCTLVPTLEAANGYNKVSADFELEDYWPGRAVSGLHKVVDTQSSDAPKGTILEVRKPGFALANRIEQAEVVISDGAEYKSPHEHKEPKTLDLRLPHPRAARKWGALWVPTQPSHFEAPAVWGWDANNGHFVQLAGPVWDPLHYYYESVEKVKQAEATHQLQENPWLVKVPDDMRLKCYPAKAMRGFDTFNMEKGEERFLAGALTDTPITRHDDGKLSCEVGYHPLPLFFDYELWNWWFPELDPRTRLSEKTVPFQHENNICDVIKPQVRPIEYKNTLVADASSQGWVLDEAMLAIPSSNDVANFPDLMRYLGGADEGVVLDATPMWLQHLPDEILSFNVGDFWEDDYEQVETLAPGLFGELQEYRDKCLKLMRLRHRIFRENPQLYRKAFWENTPIADLETTFFQQTSGEEKKTSKLSAAMQGTPVVTDNS